MRTLGLSIAPGPIATKGGPETSPHPPRRTSPPAPWTASRGVEGWDRNITRPRACRSLPCRPWPRPGCGSPRPSASAAGCTTLHHKTHGTGAGGEVSVLYAWHPWAGRTVRLEEVIARATGTGVRCSLVDAPVTRFQEIPAWMLDPVACGTVRATGQPVAALSALRSLHALLADAAGGRDRAANRPRLASPEPRGDRHATSSAPAAPAVPATRTRPDERATDPGHAADLGRSAGVRPTHVEEPPDPPARRACSRRRSAPGRPSRR
jgi:hypothetical protein